MSYSALQDLQHAIDLSPDTDAKAECHTERGMTYQKMHDFAQAVKDLKQVYTPNSPPSDMQVEVMACSRMSTMITVHRPLQIVHLHVAHMHALQFQLQKASPLSLA